MLPTLPHIMSFGAYKTARYLLEADTARALRQARNHDQKRSSSRPPRSDRRARATAAGLVETPSSGPAFS